jgi:hexosaminidase
MTSAHLDRMARVSIGRRATPQQVAARWRHLYENGDLAVGVDAGRWDPTMMSESFVTREWDITNLLNRGGLWTVQPRYTSGAHGIAVSEIALIRRGSGPSPGVSETVVATDTHEAWIGTDVRNARFRLPVSGHDPDARYFVRLRLRSDGGTDSNGTITLYAPPE